MQQNPQELKALKAQLAELQKQHQAFEKEIISLQHKLNQAMGTTAPTLETPAASKPAMPASPVPKAQPGKPQKIKGKKARDFKLRADWENFIGENLVSKIGIAITVLGVGIGAKYSIEHQLISPWIRIVMGYVAGIVLLLLGYKLKKNYHSYSAVLVSGALAIMYFITYVAYSFYGLFPQMLTFAIMLLFTVYAVVASMQYNLQIIAHMGMVGAYAVPFLTSDNSGQVSVLFTYMFIINLGILFLAFRKYWKPLYITSFAFTWIIYLSWFATQYKTEQHFLTGSLFLVLFYLTFYVLFFAFKWKQKYRFEKTDVVLLLLNAFVFFGTGLVLLSRHNQDEAYGGLFALANAAIHGVVSFLFYRQKMADRNLFYLATGLVLVFITLAIPIQLNGNWVTFLWIGEAAVLFWIGRKHQMPMYEKLAYPLIFLALFSLFHDWSVYYGTYLPSAPDTRIKLLMNTGFMSSMLYFVTLAFITFLSYSPRFTKPEFIKKGIYPALAFSLPIVLVLVLYITLFQEIAGYWEQFRTDALDLVSANESGFAAYLFKRKQLALLHFSLLYMIVLTVLNGRWIKHKIISFTLFGLQAYLMLVYLFLGLYVLSEMRDNYLEHVITQNGWLLRYLSFAIIGGLLASGFYNLKKLQVWQKMQVAYHALIYVTVLWLTSSELIHWLHWTNHHETYKLGLSILWGVYALLLIAVGIWKHQKHLRIGALALFLVTLIKLFVYDIAHLNTLSKTIIFVTLGVLLLIISFLYNKYKQRITEVTKP